MRLLAALALGCVLACAPGEAAESTDSLPGGSLGLSKDLGPTSSASIAQRIASAPQRVAFHGLRRVRSHYRLIDEERELEVLERVASDGQGRFALEAVDVVVPTLSPDEEELFVLLSRSRAGFLYRHRDFSIHSLSLFSQSYRVQVVGTSEHIGRDVLALDVRRREDPGRRYRLLVDTQTALVLSVEELTLDGRPIASSVFEEIRFEAPPAEFEFYEPPFEREPLDPQGEGLEAALGFPALRPSLLPPGYRLTAMDRFEDRGRVWLRQSFGDGVEELFFLHSPLQGSAPAEGAAGAPHGRLVLAPIGPWLLADGELGGHSVIALGKVGEGALVRLIRSALEPAASSGR